MAAVAETDTRIEPTDWQGRVLSVPEDADLFLGGGRGGGKSMGMLLLILRHVEQLGHLARVLVLRRNFPDMRDLEAEARYLFRTAYGKALSHNAQTHRFTTPAGGVIQFDQYEGPADFHKVQGQSNSLIAVDECGQYPEPGPLDMLRSTLRTKANIRPRMILCANPGGVGHGWVFQRHVSGCQPWKPYTEPKTGAPFVTAPSVWSDNPHLSADYPTQIEASTSMDPELRKAWLKGDWHIERGAFFGAVFESSRNVIPLDDWTELPGTSMGDGMSPIERKLLASNMRNAGISRSFGWETFLAGDHGSAAPAWFGLMARSPGAKGPDGRFFPRGSLVLFDEVAFVQRDTLNTGLGMTVPMMAADVAARCETWGMRPEGVMDDACFAKHGSQEGTLADEYRKSGLSVQPARKGDRISGWAIMRKLLSDAGATDKPGLYVSERCSYWLATVPFLDRDQRRPEDLDTTQADHAADGTRYGCLFEQPRLTRKKLKGL